ncbi:MAG: DUF5060 domain-containing protein [Prolixibacteraceae bacterium]|nr:DUF5060 domain-containing protein [Prolixibacteraceae bacterium]MBN2773082.1 DUF5060 domain-containing protein [Prolixibacteraceae bacterium]
MNKFLLLPLIVLFSCNSTQKKTVNLNRELKKWHSITLEIEGSETSEWAKENPFLDYRLEVTFKNNGHSYKVPGFYAADGNAAETSADKGNIWKVRFLPDQTGEWNYTVSFRKGKDIVLNSRPQYGEALSADGFSGSFYIEESDKNGPDFRSKGRLVNGGKGYLKFLETGEVWIKNGADSPENFLAYEGFDQTLRYSLKTEVREGEADPKKDLHKYEPHIKDWKQGDPSWQSGKGKGIIGALNYLASEGVNSQYMLTMNIMGDGKDVWPYNDHNERYRFDCSKLDQWEIVFSHMDKLGMMIHFVIQETENETLLDNGNTDVQRMVYLRELVARFSHHPAVTWNLGEENGPADWSPLGQSDQQKKAMADYLKSINPYPCFVVLHTHSDDEKQDKYLEPMLGYENLDGPSMQIGNPFRVYERISKWVNESKDAGKRWVVNLDEIGQHWKGVLPDSFDENHDTVRYQCLWGTLMAGGAGVEWYFGYRYPETDLTCEDFRSREKWWKQSTIATSFFKSLPVEEMQPANQLIDSNEGWCFANPGNIYVIYLPDGNKKVNIYSEENNEYQVRWFNPRKGGDLQKGSIDLITGIGNIGIGTPPETNGKDWVAVIKRNS